MFSCLLHHQILADAKNSFPRSPEFDNFASNIPWVDVDSPSVSDIPGFKEQFKKQLESKIDKRNHSKSIQMPKKVRLIN